MTKNKLEILKGDGEVNEILITNTKHLYKVLAIDELLLKENTLYFPGWQVKNNKKAVMISYQNKKYPGIITFKIPKGESIIEIYYEDTDVVKFSRIVSLITLIFIIFFFIKKLFFPKLKI